MKRLRNLPLRVWTILPLTIIISAAVFRLTWNIPYSIATVSKVLWGLAIGVTSSGYLFLLHFLIRPGITKKLKTRAVRIGVTAVVTTALLTLTIHTIRFLPSPEAILLQSKVMAILLLAALISAYPLILRYIWRVWRREDRG